MKEKFNFKMFLFFFSAICMLVAAMLNFIFSEEHALGVIWLCLGSSMLCLGSLQMNKKSK